MGKITQGNSLVDLEDNISCGSVHASDNSFNYAPLEGRSEPMLWFKRLVIWRSPSEPAVRTIQFHRGLNIVWSDRDGNSSTGRINPSQMDVGSTSLVRLMRYCMGEMQFGPEDHELKVREMFPNGAVGAVIRLNKTDWAVVRSFSDFHDGAAESAKSLEDVWKDFHKTKQNDFRLFLEAISKTFKPEMPTFKTRGHEVALGFISRDHNGGFLNPFRWRASHNNSGPVIKQKRREGALCALLGFDAVDQSSSTQEPDPPKRARIEISRPVAEAWVRTVKQLGLRGEHKKDIVKLIEESEKREQEAATLFKGNQKEWEDTQGRIVEMETSKAVLVQLRVQLDLAQKASDAIQARLRQLGETCRLTHKEACDLIQDEGCLLSNTGCDPKTLKSELGNVRQTIKTLKNEMAKKERRINSLAKKVIGDRAGTIESALLEQKKKLRMSDSALREAQEIMERCKNLALMIPTASSTNDDGRKPLQSTEGCDSLQKNQNFGDFCLTYQRIVRYLIDPRAIAKIERGSEGIQIHIKLDGKEYSGSNVSLMKLLAFDFAVLLRSMEAEVFLPGLLIHDSPRQQDLTNGEYWKLFRLAHSLEQKDPTQIPFQYVITTTSPPPEELRDPGHVVLTLGPGQQWSEGLLFGRRL